jgi:uncharacterized phage protein gp47/JayE
MANFGVTADGFTIKGLDVILSNSLSMAQQVFSKNGFNVDLTPTSTLRKILEVAAAEDAELWKRMEDMYYSNFVSTAIGPSLDRLGEDLGLTRQNLFSNGTLTLTLANGVPGRNYVLAPGTILLTGAQKFSTTDQVTLNTSAPKANNVAVVCLDRGAAGDLPAAQAFTIDPQYQQLFLTLGQAVVTGANDQPFSGGAEMEDDETYRARLLGLPRNLWTLESITQAALEVDGVIDVLAFDPLGGVDISQSYFNLFNFDQRLFSAERSLGEPYYFDLIVAHEFSQPWQKVGAADGVFDKVTSAVDRVRPVGIHPNIIEANHIQVGMQAGIIVAPGVDTSALLGALKQRLNLDLGQPKLGGEVRYSQVMRAITEQTGVVDVQNLHLRRCPPQFNRISFGTVPFQSEVIEAGPGENLIMGPREIAIFQIDSELLDFEVTTQ